MISGRYEITCRHCGMNFQRESIKRLVQRAEDHLATKHKDKFEEIGNELQIILLGYSGIQVLRQFSANFDYQTDPAIVLFRNQLHQIIDGSKEPLTVVEFKPKLSDEVIALKIKLATEKQGAKILDDLDADANDKLAKLAGLILECDLITPKGIRAKNYARQALNIRYSIHPVDSVKTEKIKDV